MTTEERAEWEEDLRMEYYREAQEEAAYEAAMQDPDFAASQLERELSDDLINTYKHLKKQCYLYGVDLQELLDNL
jgi:hypothetical protein